MRGSIPIGNLSNHKADMMVSAAGFLFSGMVEPENDIVVCQDRHDFEERLAEYAKENGICVELAGEKFGQTVIDETAVILVQYWQTIDWLATALLLNCNAAGDVRLGPIFDYFYSVPSRLVIGNRSTYFQVPKEYAAYVAGLHLTASVPVEW